MTLPRVLLLVWSLATVAGPSLAQNEVSQLTPASPYTTPTPDKKADNPVPPANPLALGRVQVGGMVEGSCSLDQVSPMRALARHIELSNGQVTTQFK